MDHQNHLSNIKPFKSQHICSVYHDCSNDDLLESLLYFMELDGYEMDDDFEEQYCHKLIGVWLDKYQ